MELKAVTTVSPIDRLLDKLDDVHGSAGKWRAKCPVHQTETSKHRSLSIKETETGSVLLHCHAGCTTEAVVTQAGLTLSDLFPPLKYTQYAKHLKQQPTGRSKVYIRDETSLNINILTIAIGLLEKGAQLTDEEVASCARAIFSLRQLHDV